MSNEGPWGGAIKTIIDAGRGSIDFIAFALISVLAVGGLLKGLGFSYAAGIVVVLASVWVAMRYALLSLQSRERLRLIRENATIEARRKLAKHATDDEMRDLFDNYERDGDDDEL